MQEIRLFKTKYAHKKRFKNTQEVLACEIPLVDIDLFIYCMDLYKIYLQTYSGDALDTTGTHKWYTISMKLKDYILKHYYSLHVPFPGIVFGWTKSMLLWILYLSCYRLGLSLTPPELTHHDVSYINEAKLRIFKDEKFSTQEEIMDVLGILAFRWHTVDKDKIKHFLSVLWYRTAQLTLFTEPDSRKLPITTFTDSSRHRINTKCIIACLSRFFVFEKSYTITLYRSPTRVDRSHLLFKWVEREKQYLVSSKFRETMLTFIWQHVTCAGDVEIETADDLEEQMSLYACLNKRLPASLINRYQKIITYKSFEEIMETPLRPFLILCLINEKITNVYNIAWFKHFYVQNVYKHEAVIKDIQVPLLCFIDKKFVVFDHVKRTYVLMDCVEDAFLYWLDLTKHTDFVCYDSFNFKSIYDEIQSFESKDEENNQEEREINDENSIFFELEP